MKGPRSSVASAIIRGSSHRRRARANGTYTVAADHTKRRALVKASPPVRIDLSNVVSHSPPSTSTPKDIEMQDATASAAIQGATPTFSVFLPRVLSRPQYRAVPGEKVSQLDAELASLPLDYIQDRLADLGPEMLSVVSSVEADTSAHTLPRELAIMVHDLSSDMPTHMLAVYGRQSETARRRVTLYPTHSIIWAAHSALLPSLPPSHPPTPAQNEHIMVPVVPLCLPDPATFPELQAYLYTKRADRLLAALLPSPPPLEKGQDAILAYARELARTFTPQALLMVHMAKVRGLWRNASALGVFDRGLWAMVDLSWEILLNAVAIGTGKPLQAAEVPRRAQL